MSLYILHSTQLEIILVLKGYIYIYILVLLYEDLISLYLFLAGLHDSLACSISDGVVSNPEQSLKGL